MSDRITDTIAEALAEADDIIYGLLTPDETEHYLKGARAVLAALRANNIEPIQLPDNIGAEVIGVEFWDCDGEGPEESHITVAVPRDWEPRRVYEGYRGFADAAGLWALSSVLAAAAAAEEKK